LTPVHLDPGIYLNLFPVLLPSDEVRFAVAARSLFPDLRPLRRDISAAEIDAQVYADGDRVYGYGPDAGFLKDRGFETVQIVLPVVPRLATRLIVEGIVNRLKAEGYETVPRKWRWQVFHPDQFTSVGGGGVRIHAGYDLGARYWRDAGANALAYGLCVDAVWSLRDCEGQPLNMRRIKQQFGSGVAVAIGRVEGEYLPQTNRINTEIARSRLLEYLLPFVEAHAEFDLPCGVQARLVPEPVRVVLGE
jgi:hypothetical protein